MKKNMAAFLTLAMTLFSQAESLDVGSSHYGPETLSVLIFNGHLTMNGTTIQDELRVNGSLEAEKILIEKIHVNGRAILKDCHVDGKTEINGYLTAEKTEFHALLALKSNKLDLIDSLTHEILIRKSGDPAFKQVVNLKNTKVYGDIVFEGQNGLVVADEDSFIEGDILGGELDKKE